MTNRLRSGRDESPSRRKFLKLAGVSGSLAVAGCLGSGTESGGDDDGDENSGNDDSGDDASGTDGQDQQDEIDFPSDNLRFIIGHGPGGGFDTWARGAGDHLVDHLPNEVSIAYENMEGAGGTRSAVELYRAEPDGHTLGVSNVSSWILTELNEDVDYVTQDFTWLGAPAKSIHCVLSRVDSGYDTIEDMQNADEELRVATSSPTSGRTVSFRILADILDIPYRLVTGYGTSDGVTALARGDAEIVPSPVSSILPAIEDGEVNLALTFTEDAVDHVDIDYEPQTLTDIDHPELAGMAGTLRGILAPPDVPAEQTEILRSSLEEAIQSDEFAEWAESQELVVRYASGEKVLQDIKNAQATFSEYMHLFEE